MMKKTMIMLLAAAMPSVAAWCEVGDELTANVQTDGGETEEMTFTVTSEEEGNKTCQVGDGTNWAINMYTSGGLEIPGEVNGYTVTRIGDKAFYFCDAFTSFVIPDCVTSIGASAFLACYALTSINIPDGVTSIGESAFKCCYALTSISIPAGVTSIEAETFYECFSLTSVDISDGVENIGESAFIFCI